MPVAENSAGDLSARELNVSGCPGRTRAKLAPEEFLISRAPFFASTVTEFAGSMDTMPFECASVRTTTTPFA